MRGGRRTVGLIAAAVALALPLPIALAVVNFDAGDFSGIQDLPLPGGADLGDHPYTVTAEFGDVLSLVPQSAVKVNDVSVGRVSDIELSDNAWTARVTMRVNGDVRLPANAYARIEQSSLLGEKYVQLIPPPEKQQVDAALGGNDTLQARAAAPSARVPADIPLERTNRNPEVEEVFGALSLLLNGGGIDQIRNITTELNKALEGNEPEVRSMLRRVNTFTKNLDNHKGDITDALDGVNKLSARLAGRKGRIGAALEELSPGMKTLEEQRGALVTMLKSLDKLSTTAVDTIEKSKKDMVADLRALGPILKNLADAGQALPESLEVLLTYPFTDEVLSGVKGDYLNIYLKVASTPGTQIIPPITEDPIPGKAGPLGGTAGTAGTALAPLPLPLPSVGPPTTSAPSGDDATASPGGGGSSPPGNGSSASPSDEPSAGDSPSGSGPTEGEN